MNVWLDAPDGPPDRFISYLLRYIDERSPEDGLAAAVELIMGMSHLSGALLLLVEEATGSPPRDTLEEFALLYDLA